MWHFIIQPNGLLIELNAKAVQWMEIRCDLSWLPWPSLSLSLVSLYFSRSRSLSLSLSVSLSCASWCPGANYSGKDTVIVWDIFWVMKREDRGSNDFSCLMTQTDPQILTPIRVHCESTCALLLLETKPFRQSFSSQTHERFEAGKYTKTFWWLETAIDKSTFSFYVYGC